MAGKHACVFLLHEIIRQMQANNQTHRVKIMTLIGYDADKKNDHKIH